MPTLRNIMKSAACFIFLSLFASVGLCQTKPYYITIFTHDNWASFPSEKLLVENIKQGQLLTAVKGSHFNHYTPKDEMYKERFPKIDPSTFPVLMVQRASDGAVVYKASGANIPTTPNAIYGDIKYYRDAALGSEQPAAEQEGEGPEGRRPWLDQDEDDADGDEENPDSYEIFNGRTPIRDSLANSATFMQSAMILGLVIVVIFSFAFCMKAFK